MGKIIRISVGIIVSGIFFSIGIAQAEDVEKIMKKINDTYEKITSFQANFLMEGINGKNKFKGEGKIWNKESKFRMEMKMVPSSEKEEEKSVNQKQVIVFDGKVFWVHSQINDQDQVMMLDTGKLAGLPDTLRDSVEQFKEEFEKAPSRIFSPEPFLEKEVTLSEGEWRGEDFYILRDEQREIWVKKKDYLMYRVITRSEKGEVVSRVEITEIKVNEDIPEEVFTFSIPSGVEVRDIIKMMEEMYKGFEKKR